MVQLKPSYVMLALLSAAFVQCGGEATPEPETPEAPMAPLPEPAPASGTGEEAMTEAAPEPEPEPPKPEPLTDEQIIMVTDTANMAEIDQAKLAQKKAKHPRVKKYAGMMISDHTKAKNKQKQLVTKLKITAADSTVATTLKTDTSSAMDSMKELASPDFDKAYIDAQIDNHKKLLDALDTQMIPGAQNEDLKKLLEDLRPKVEAHLKEAQDIQGVLATAAEAAAAGEGGAKPTK